MIPQQKKVHTFNDPVGVTNPKIYFDLKSFVLILFIEGLMILSEYAKVNYHYNITGLSITIAVALIMAALFSTLFKWYLEKSFRGKL